jgi:hypothetical protein
LVYVDAVIFPRICTVGNTGCAYAGEQAISSATNAKRNGHPLSRLTAGRRSQPGQVITPDFRAAHMTLIIFHAP